MKRLAGLLSLSLLFAGCSTAPMFSQESSTSTTATATVERMARLQGCDPYKGATPVSGASGQDYQVQCANGQQLYGHCDGNDCSVHIASSGPVGMPVARTTTQPVAVAPAPAPAAVQSANATPAVAAAPEAPGMQTTVAIQPFAHASPNPLKAVLAFGVTSGGDTLATAIYTDNSTANIKAGSGVQFGLGAEYRLDPDFAVQGTVNYQVDNASASNGDLRFSRIPVEVLGYYYLADKWRVGGGVRFVEGAKLIGSGSISFPTVDFKNTTGAVLEVEYLLTPHFGLKLRGVKESFKLQQGSSETISGNQIGLFFDGYY